MPDLRVISIAVPGNGQLTPDFRRSDHRNFWDANYQALLLTDGANFRNPNYHLPSDTLGTLDFYFMANVVKAIVASVAKLAEIRHSGIGISNEFDLNISSISQSDDTRPLVIHMEQNYPNPFNPSTTIEFSIPKAEFVTLKIYNILGQEVDELVAKRLVAGSYNYSWDASGFASGIYYYKIETGSFTQSRKLILMK